MTSATTRVEQLHAATLVAINECKRLSYRPTYWEQMVKELGALDAHKQVLRPGPPHDGFVRLAFLMNPPHPELTENLWWTCISHSSSNYRQIG